MKVKVVVHNHWDREWFTSSEVTSKWLKEVFFRVKELVQKNPEFVYVLDGQTAAVEDLLVYHPDLEEDLRELVRSGRLLVGPYYIQIDWRIPGEASILKNFEIGEKDTNRFGRRMNAGWLLDSFGHISQEPQLHRIFGIEKVFLWRGISFENDGISQEFFWKGSDGTAVQGVFLVGGYRNLYNLKETRDIAEKRLKHEVEKLAKFSRSGEILLLDGYDIDLSPEDPKDYLNVEIVSPEEFPERFPEDAPTLSGELLSGRYACVFPGTLSTRAYLKLESDLVEKLLKMNDLLSVLNGEELSDLFWRDYLKTLAHDNSCGVCADHVHEKMERTYRNVYFLVKSSVESRLRHLVERSGLEKGTYALSLSPFSYNHHFCDGERTFLLKTNGAGLFKTEVADEKKEVKELTWENEYYRAYFEGDGTLVLNNRKAGVLKLFKEDGDAYTTSVEETDFSISLEKMRTVLQTKHSMVVELERTIRSSQCLIETKERVIFDETPLVKWRIALKIKGKNYKLSMVYETGSGEIFAKMPFDVVKRKEKDSYLLPETPPEELKGILLAARETGEVREFPFQGFVSVWSEESSKTILARGLREYWMEEGKVHVTLSRSVEWIAKEVKNRVGDAGPMMYVPGAKCEGVFTVDLAFMELPVHPRSEEFFRWYLLFDNPPLLLDVEADGTEKEKTFFFSSLPWAGVKDRYHLWVYNPYLEEIEGLRPLQIGEKSIESLSEKQCFVSRLNILNFPEFPVVSVEKNPEGEVIEFLKETLSSLEDEITDLEGKDDPRSKHRLFSLLRTKKEIELSLQYLIDVEKTARELNELRMKRRTYDYVVELFESEERE
jgi:alpha-mannosidase